MLISLCMIVRDEEKVLGRCLDSVQGLADEIIIVDTGSQDGTKEIARKYTDHVYDFEWINDFAAARNQSLRHASGDWILVMDADEYVQPGMQDQLRRKLERMKADRPHCFLVKIMNFHGDRGEQLYESTGARLFTNKRGIYYKEPIHEQLECSEGQIQFEMDSFALFHSGYMTDTVMEKGKNERNMKILLDMATESKLQDPFFCFILGNEYANSGSQEQAYEYYKRAMEKAPLTTAWYEHLLDRLCQTALKTRNLKDAEVYIELGKQRWPEQADYHCLEGMLFECLGFYNRALLSFQRCLEIVERCQAKGEKYWVIEERYGGSIPHLTSAEIARKCADLHKMVYHLTAVLKVDRQNFSVLRMLLRTLARHESSDNVLAFMNKLFPISDPKNAFVLLQVAQLEGLAELAVFYWDACKENNVPLKYADELSFHLLEKKEANPKSSQLIDPRLALLASVVYKDSRYCNMAESQNALLNKLAQQLLEERADKVESQPWLADEYALLTQLIVQLLQYGYINEYESLVNRFADEELLHRLAEQLNSLDYADIAIELYSILLDNDLLRGEGYKQLGIYCLVHGNFQQGILFMQKAVELSPSLDMLGLVMENSADQDVSEFVRAFTDWTEKEKITLPLLTGSNSN
ncbi:TPR domain-containing glycosyltransferase [Cohnella zeiphila]|uniref:Glycosyltransferase n=1 Tax=Cohnella zeiphila TaxID=2761120 RepID=A0A7X0VVK5_9BACL|nr:TPR domain-containing glycosyltransferase [Cohnella zeiphila]MBB6732249.1 glycosyltransferase [Cohnella zeiphila]